jgi:hypothetical protein
MDLGIVTFKVQDVDKATLLKSIGHFVSEIVDVQDA